jgi:aspartate-semialdehyde dehydrogenase
VNSTRGPTLAVVGATGAVGGELLLILAARADVWGEIRLLAGTGSTGRHLGAYGIETEVVALSEAALEDVDVAMFCVPAAVSAHWAPVAVAAGAVVLDSSAAFRMDPAVPLVVPEVNPGQIRNRPKGIVASPGGISATMLDAVGSLHRGWGLRALVLASYQAASGAGKAGIERLYDEIEVAAANRGLGTWAGDVRQTSTDKLGASWPFGAPLALNVVPWAGSAATNGWSSEELEIRDELRKVLDIAQLKVSATCVRVPVVTTHSVAVHVTFERAVSVGEARRALVEAPSVVVIDDPAAGEFPTPADAVGCNPTFVGRIRQALDFPDTLELFLCGDNLRKGSALNLAQIGERVAAE